MAYPSSVDAGQITPWYLANPNALSALVNGASTLTANTTYVHDVYAPCPCIVTGFKIRHSGVSAGHLDLGIFDQNGNLLTHTGSIAATGVTTVQTATLGTQLWIAQGRYYFGLWVDNSTDTYLQVAMGTGAGVGLMNIGTGASTNAGGLLASFTAMGGLTTTNTVFVPFLATLLGSPFS